MAINPVFLQHGLDLDRGLEPRAQQILVNKGNVYRGTNKLIQKMKTKSGMYCAPNASTLKKQIKPKLTPKPINIPTTCKKSKP